MLCVDDRHSMTPSSIGPTFISNFVEWNFLCMPRGSMWATLPEKRDRVLGERCRESPFAHRYRWRRLRSSSRCQGILERTRPVRRRLTYLDRGKGNIAVTSWPSLLLFDVDNDYFDTLDSRLRV